MACMAILLGQVVMVAVATVRNAPAAGNTTDVIPAH